jgi:hypothetical protein
VRIIPPQAGDIGEPEREVTFEPIEQPAPLAVPEPSTPAEDPELVPA